MEAAAKPARMNRRGRVLKILLFLVVIDGLLLGGAELLAGWFGPPYYRQVVRKQHLEGEAPPGKRIFVFGESTIDGWPYGSKASIAAWMEEILKEVAPASGIQVVNFGKPGRGSPHLEEAVRGTLHLKPAAIVVCVGHNEFLARTLSLTLRPTHRWCYFHLNLYRLAYDKACNWRSRQGQDFEQTTAEGFRADSETYRQAVAAYEAHLNRIAQQCRTAGVPLLLALPAANLDWVPTAAYFPSGVGEQDQGVYRKLLERRLAAWRAGDDPVAEIGAGPRGSIAQARLRYWEGRGLRNRQEETAAYSAFAAARDLDGLPLRGQQSLAEALQRVGAKQGVPVLLLPEVFAGAAEGVPDSHWFMDHCHPRPWGQRLLAAALIGRLEKEGWLGISGPCRWERLPETETLARRLGVEASAWRDPEVESVKKQLRLNPELAVDLTALPPLFVPAADAEWQALRGVALWRCGRHVEATRVRREMEWNWQPPATWEPELRQLWSDWSQAAATVAKP